jgi:DNA-binding LytR/AlgR family response regulator
LNTPSASAPLLRVLIVDDEALAAERLALLCGRLSGVAVVGIAGDGRRALSSIEELAPDLVLLDISMPGMDGVALARALAIRNERPAIVFVTAHDSYAVTAFELAATDYLLKPVSLQRLEQAVARAAMVHQAPRPPVFLSEIWAPRAHDMLRVGVDTLDLLAAERDYVRLHVSGQSYLLRMTLRELEERLDPDRFVRLHRSAIVPMDRIRALGRGASGRWEVLLSTGAKVRVGRTFHAAVQRIIAGPK